MHRLKMYARCVIASIVYYSGLFKARLANINRDHFIVLMYHRVLPYHELGPYVQPGMYVEPNTFEQHLIFLNKHFVIRPIQELINNSSLSNRNKRDKHTCYLTFDDGWSDFYHYVYPLLLKHNVPATVYLPTGFIGTNRAFWTERFAHLCEVSENKGFLNDVLTSTKAMLDSSGALAHDTSEEIYERLICRFKNLKEETIDNILGMLERQFDVTYENENNNFLNWDQISETIRSGLVHYGSHTEFHKILTNLNDDEVLAEIKNGVQALMLNSVMSKEQVTFCYPSGRYNERIINLLQKEGCSLSVTTKNGWNNSKTPELELKRVGLHQDISKNAALLAYRVFVASWK